MSAATAGVDPNSRDQPLVRLSRSVFAGIIIASLVVAGVAIYGLIVPGGATSWREGDALIVETETGTRYVLRDGTLYPVLNYTSARLILGDAEPKVRRVAAASLRGVPHGRPAGITGAPETLPPAKDLVRDPWTVCVQSGRDGTGSSRPVLTVDVGERPALDAKPIGPQEALPVRGPDGTTHLVWLGQRLRVGTPDVLAAIGYTSVPALLVSAGWLSALPAGPDLAPMPVADMGQPSPITVDRMPARIGQVFVARALGSDAQYFQLRGNELTALSELQATVQLTDPQIEKAYPGARPGPIDVSPTAVTGARRTGDPTLPVRPPTPVTVAPETTAACVDIADAVPGSGAQVPAPYVQRVGAEIAAVTGSAPVGVHGGPVADRVSVPPGLAALVVAAPGPATADGTWYLVSDVGVRYPLSPDALDALGYRDAAPVHLPAAVVSLLPPGPRLDRGDAQQVVPVTPPTATGR